VLPLPKRPMLRPGVHVVRRDDRHLQVGLHPQSRLVLPDRPEVHDLLAAVAEGRTPAPTRWYADLVARGLVLDADTAEAVAAGRSAARIAVDADDACRPATLRLLAAAGLTLAAGERVTLRLVLRAGTEPAPEDLDPLVRDAVPHLLLGGLGGLLTIGPFVAPGLTACRRCVAAHLCDRDPGEELVRAQYRRKPSAAVDPLLLALACAWVVRDAATYVDGGTPRTWSATVALDDSLACEARTWTRHPACGCSWGDGLAVA
jgi:hypothetical protein